MNSNNIPFNSIDGEDDSFIVEDADVAQFFASLDFFLPQHDQQVKEDVKWPQTPESPVEAPTNQFCLQFLGCNGEEPQLKVDLQHTLQISLEPVCDTVDLVLRRSKYIEFPMQHINKSGEAACPFSVNGVGSVEYRRITVENASHYGARINLKNATSMRIMFHAVSSMLTPTEREVQGLKMHTAKHLELLLVSTTTNEVLVSESLQVVKEFRKSKNEGKKRQLEIKDEPVEAGPAPKVAKPEIKMDSRRKSIMVASVQEMARMPFDNLVRFYELMKSINNTRN